VKAAREADVRNLRGLKNISWLSSRQLNRLAATLSMSTVEKREIIIDDKHSRESAYVLLSGSRVSRVAIAMAIAH